MSTNLVSNWLATLREVFSKERDSLSELDAAVGDGDHGASMQRGFAAAYESITESQQEAGAMLTAAGGAFMKAVGGASGPLLATVFLELGKVSKRAGSFDLQVMIEGINNAVRRVESLGHAQPGDKTLLDALVPAKDALERAGEEGLSFKAGVSLALTAAESGAAATTMMVARKGRASFVEGSGIGRVDPGAQTISHLFRALAESMRRGNQ